MAVEEEVEGLADGVERGEGGDGEVADLVEQEVVVAAHGVDEVEAWLGWRWAGAVQEV